MASIAKRGNTFRIMVSLGYGMDGRQIRKTTTYTPPDNVTDGKARKLAEAAAHDFERRCRGAINLGENMRFHELASWYFEQIAPNTLKGITIYNQTQLLNSYILPELGHLNLKDISTARLDEFFNRLCREGGSLERFALIDTDIIPKGQRAPLARKAGISAGLITNLAQGKNVWRGTADKIAAAMGRPVKEVFYLSDIRKGLSPSTVRNVVGIISAVFRMAVRKGIVEKSPAQNTTPPKREKNMKPFFDDDQCRRLLTILEEHPDRQFAVIVKTLLYTGLRAGELCALHWGDFDLDAPQATLRVRHTLTRLNGEYMPKTKRSERVINIPAELADVLIEHRDSQSVWGAAMGSSWEHTGQVFTNESGGYHSRGLINAKIKRLLEKHDLPDCSTHDLRHANASLLINAGVPAKFVAEHLGHNSTRTTEDIYAHMFAASRAKVTETIVSALRTELPGTQG